MANELATLATCWRLTRKDGTIMGFTDFSKNIIIDNICYCAKTGFKATAVETKSTLQPADLDIDGALTSDAITEADIIAGKYDFAEILVFEVDYTNLVGTQNILRRGFLGNLARGDTSFKAEIRGLGELTERKIGSLYSDTCRAKFCDSKCGLKAADYTFTGTVVSSSDGGSCIVDVGSNQVATLFSRGQITFISGLNAGTTMDIVTHTKEGTYDVLTLLLSLPGTIQAGDTVSIMSGCDGAFSTCRERGNYLNFRGEPDIPGTDAIYCYPSD